MRDICKMNLHNEELNCTFIIIIHLKFKNKHTDFDKNITKRMWLVVGVKKDLHIKITFRNVCFCFKIGTKHRADGY